MSTNPKIFIKRLIEKLNDKDLIIEQQKSFIQQQDKMIELACESGARLGCPMFEHDPCPEMTTEVTCSECWRKYLQSEVSK